MLRRNVLRRGSILTLIALAAAVQGASVDALTKSIDALGQTMVDSRRTAALGIAIDVGGKKVLDKGYGFADIEKKVKATPTTVYRIGSVTKQFTAAESTVSSACSPTSPSPSALSQYSRTPKVSIAARC